MKNSPLITVITVCFNSEKYISDCINSVNHQTYEKIEHIFIDGGSTDKTLEIIQNHANRNSVVVSEPDRGIYDAMNKGLELCTGEIIGFLNSDDLYSNNNVLSKIAEIFNNSNVDIVHGDLQFINENNEVVRSWKGESYYSGQFARSMSPAHPTFYCKRAVFDKVGRFTLDYKIVGDLEFMFRSLEISKMSSSLISENLVIMRLGGISTESIYTSWSIYKEVKNFHLYHGVSFNSFVYWRGKFLKFLKQKVFNR